jgi:hypothetical protein
VTTLIEVLEFVRSVVILGCVALIAAVILGIALDAIQGR